MHGMYSTERCRYGILIVQGAKARCGCSSQEGVNSLHVLSTGFPVATSKAGFARKGEYRMSPYEIISTVFMGVTLVIAMIKNTLSP